MNPIKYKAAIIGLGFIGGGDQESGDRIGQKVAGLDGYHRQALARHPQVSLAAGSDFNDDCCRRFVARTSLPVYADWQQMLDVEEPEIVSVAAWTPARVEIVVACANSGVRAIYCEKPIATSVNEANAMISACDDNGALLVINHNRRFNPSFRMAADRIAEGAIGELTSILMRWSGGRFACTGTHLIDAAIMLSGRRVRAVSGLLDLRHRDDCRGPQFYDPGGWGMMKMDGGVAAVIDAANYNAGPLQLLVEGTEGHAVSGGGDVTLQWHDGRREQLAIKDPSRTSMDRAVDEIVDWLDDGRPPGVHVADSLMAMEAIVGLHVSNQRNSALVQIPLQGEDREFRVVSG